MSIELVLATVTILATGLVGAAEGAGGRVAASSQPASAPEPRAQPCSCACSREPPRAHPSTASPNAELDLGETAHWPSN
jgi:hypothetical protein